MFGQLYNTHHISIRKVFDGDISKNGKTKLSKFCTNKFFYNIVHAHEMKTIQCLSDYDNF